MTKGKNIKKKRTGSEFLGRIWKEKSYKKPAQILLQYKSSKKENSCKVSLSPKAGE